MNKKALILQEAKKLFGQYGYLGFTLKQLALACDMTSPALYYFFDHKAGLFRDCLLAEMETRREVTERCMAKSSNLAEFAEALTHEAIAVCDKTSFRTGNAMQEIIHLPQEMQVELRASCEANLYAPVEEYLQKIIPKTPANLPHHLLAVLMINMATFSSLHAKEYPPKQLAALFQMVVSGLE